MGDGTWCCHTSGSSLAVTRVAHWVKADGTQTLINDEAIADGCYEIPEKKIDGRIRSGSGSALISAVEDVSGDGLADIILSSGSSIGVMTNQGDGTWNYQTIGRSLTDPRFAHWVNADGTQTLIKDEAIADGWYMDPDNNTIACISSGSGYALLNAV